MLSTSPYHAHSTIRDLASALLHPRVSRRFSVRAAKGFGPAPKPQPSSSKKQKGGKSKRLKGIDDIAKAVERADVKASHVPLSQQELRERLEAKRSSRGNDSAAASPAAAEVSSSVAGSQKAAASTAGSQKAAEGSYDYVKVRDWGPGQPVDLGNLQVESFAPGDDPADDAKPFADVLARRLEWLQAQGMLTQSDAGGGGEAVPFQQWSFSERSYVQYLTDLLGVHHVLEQALSEGTVVHGPDHYGDLGDGKGVWTALELVSPRQGFARAEEIHKDLNNIAKSSGAKDPVRYQIAEPARSYASHLADCGRALVGPTSPEQHATGALRVFANAYCVYISHLGSAMRVGAVAAEKLGLAPVEAIHLYETYGATAGPDPLKSLLRNVNAAGLALSSQQRKVVIQELPEAMSHCALLLTSLATRD